MEKEKLKSASYFLENKRFLTWRLARTPDLDSFWESYIIANPDEKEELQKAIEICDKIVINKKVFENTDLLYEQILQTLKNKNKKNSKTYWFGAAAIIIIFIVSTLLIFFYNQSSVNSAVNEHIGRILPSEDIQLLSDGKLVILNQNTTIEILEKGQMSFRTKDQKDTVITLNPMSMNQLWVPNGKRSSLILADGSKICVNSGTEVVFPTLFSKTTRDIHVKGEIYVDVAKSKKQPFVVHTPIFDVKVYGTSFDVFAYQNEPESFVVLVNGEVKVNSFREHSISMKPNEKLFFKDTEFKKQTVNPELYTSWVNGYLIFNKTPINEVLRKVGRYYNVNFEQVDSPQLISGKLYLSNNINDVLSSISLLTKKRFQKKADIIEIIKN